MGLHRMTRKTLIGRAFVSFGIKIVWIQASTPRRLIAAVSTAATALRSMVLATGRGRRLFLHR